MLFLDIHPFCRELFSVTLQNKHFKFSYHKERSYMYPVPGVQKLVKIVLLLSKTWKEEERGKEEEKGLFF